VLRGGSWNNNQNNARAAYRNNGHPNNRNNNNGFRLARRSTSFAVIPGGYVITYSDSTRYDGEVPRSPARTPRLRFSAGACSHHLSGFWEEKLRRSEVTVKTGAIARI
jgi:hypothetical protein